MSRDGKATRERILDATHELVMCKGYAATSIDDILGRTGLTKGAFFYHFKSKAELARALLQRYVETEERLLAETLGRAERLSRDPLQQVVIFIGLFEEMFGGVPDTNPGCLLASYCYQNELLTDEIKAIYASAMQDWRGMLVGKFREAAEQHPPRMEVALDELADMFVTILEGGFVLARTLGDPSVIASQVRQYRNYVELLFSPP